MTEQKTEQLFKDALGNLEADVNPNLWSNIQQGLHAPIPSNPVSGSSSALQSAGILGHMTVKGLILVSAVTVSVIGTVIYFAIKKPAAEIKNETVVSPVTNPQSSVSPVMGTKTERSETNGPVVNHTRDVANEKPGAPITQKQPVAIHEKPVTGIPSGSGNLATANQLTASEVSPKVPAKDEHATEPAKASAANPSIEDNTNTTPQQQQEDGKEEFASGFAKINDYLAADDFNRKVLPNSFSPNGDHTNDVFKIKTHDLKTLEVIIFDAGGREVYSWKSLNGEWDGKIRNGDEAPDGDYYYSLNAETMDGKICVAQSFLKLFR